MFLKKEHITAVLNTGMDRVEESCLVLADGRTIGFSYAMIVSPFIGQEVIRSAGQIADEKGYVKVRHGYVTLPLKCPAGIRTPVRRGCRGARFPPGLAGGLTPCRACAGP